MEEHIVTYPSWKIIEPPKSHLEYQILSHKYIDKLEDLVCVYLKDGWSLHGSLQVCNHTGSGDTIFLQPVVKVITENE